MIKQILNKQRAFFRSGRTLSVKYRKDALIALRKAILEMEDEINAALQSDLGKSRTESYMCETGMVLSELGHAIKHIHRQTCRRKVRTPLSQFPAKSYIIPEPYGNVLIMSPWNYPLQLCLSPLASAIAAGNTAVIKPSAYSPATSSVIKKITGKVFPEEYVAVIEGGRDVNATLLDEKFDYIFFTGSKTVGRVVMGKAAEHLTPVTLELGGKSPVIVDDTADIGTAAARIVFGKYLNCGQTCVAPDYIIVHENVADKFIDACTRQIAKMFGESPIDNPDYGRIVNIKHFERLKDILHETAEASKSCDMVSRQEGSPVSSGIIYGGKTDREKLKIEPTVIRLGKITGNNWKRMGIMQDEIFGPLMPVLTYSDIEDVVSYIDSQPRPLACYIFTSSRKTKTMLTDRLHFGGGCINDTIIHLATDRMPFGGVGESGMGHYHGKYGFEIFSHLKSIVDKPSWLDLPMRYQPYTRFKEKLIRIFLK